MRPTNKEWRKKIKFSKGKKKIRKHSEGGHAYKRQRFKKIEMEEETY